ncbi:MAG: ABC transporter substrate-binding protein [Clostridia bacterium]|nr:ABC transporter substrate-binding protein [Clostridia bacterium]
MNRRLFAIILTTVFILSLLCGCGKQAVPPSAGVTLTDCAGRTVTVPADPQSICTLCPFSGPMTVLLGRGEKITSTVNNVARSKLLTSLCPSLADAVVVKNSGSMNAEEILARSTDLILVNAEMYETDAERAKLEAMGIPYVVVEFNTIEEQFRAVRVLGAALGAEEKAEAYLTWFQQALDLVDETVAGVTDPPRLYHAVNEAVRTDDRGSYCAEWIAHTRAVNVATESGVLSIEGNKAYTTLEQIYVWDPAVIICNEAQVDDYILTDPKWQGLTAVKEGQVFQIPIGITRWGHPSSIETPLALLWLAKLLYPDLFTFDLDAKIVDFYQQFFGFTPDSELIEGMKAGDEMRTAKVNSKVA